MFVLENLLKMGIQKKPNCRNLQWRRSKQTSDQQHTAAHHVSKHSRFLHLQLTVHFLLRHVKLSYTCGLSEVKGLPWFSFYRGDEATAGSHREKTVEES